MSYLRTRRHIEIDMMNHENIGPFQQRGRLSDRYTELQILRSGMQNTHSQIWKIWIENSRKTGNDDMITRQKK